ncbi:MAG: hypothetical protein AW11_04062 [Candidatus Accumulibacter regalis]|uniref:Uncharacterized protein n=1 Tax=Accumulibacter regalis TaxID=522306 RepID=A0A011Q436_ACCRE|nr:MAG: hypothetical protein AW11_04062 [Candidatus Accumulibacter regalis]
MRLDVGQIGAQRPLRQIGAQRPLREGQEVGAEVDAGEQGEKDDHELYIEAVEVSDAGVLARKTTEAHHRESVHHRVPRLHSDVMQTDAAGNGQDHIDDPQTFGRLGDARRDLGILHRARRFGLEHAAAAKTEQRQNGDGKNDDAEATDPVHEGTPEVDR